MPERERNSWADCTASSTTTSWSDLIEGMASSPVFRIPVHPVCKRCRNECKATALDPPSNYRTEADFCEEFEPSAEEKREEKNEWWDEEE